MTDFVDKCIVLKVSDYRDDDRLVKALTAEHGMVSVLLRGVKKAKAKLKPFAQAFSVFDSRLVSNKSAFLTPVEPMLIRDGFALCADLKAFAAASVAAEATIESICDEQAHADIFLEYLRLLQALYENGEPYYNAAVYITRLLEISGFYKPYAYDDEPKTPVRLLGYAQKLGYGEFDDSDLSRRALKYICGEFERNFDVRLKCSDSIDIYN